MAQCRRVQSVEKAEAVANSIEDLIDANFVRDVKYTIWLSNVVLAKKPNGKCRIYIDYTNLNKACSKDAFPLPNID